MNNELIISLSGTLLTFIGLIIQERKSKNRFEGWQNVINEIIAGLINRVNIIENLEKISKSAELFRKDFRNDINEKASLMLNGSETLIKSNTIKTAITDFGKEIAEFALKFYYSGYRKNDRVTESDFYNYLQVDINSILFNFISTLEVGLKKENGSEDERCFLHGSSLIPITFIEYLTNKNENNKEPNCFALSEILIMRLVKNGINESELKIIFLKYINDFIKEFKKEYLLFLAMPNYYTELEKKIK